jgi:hypothetical protein
VVIPSTPEPDTTPGNYYVSAVNGRKYIALVGPFKDDHAGALAFVERARTYTVAEKPESAFWSFGTCRLETDKPGTLNAILEFDPAQATATAPCPPQTDAGGAPRRRRR